MIAAGIDGGMVCFVTMLKYYAVGQTNVRSVFINVMNPLTRVGYDLPLLLETQKVWQVQIQVDNAN